MTASTVSQLQLLWTVASFGNIFNSMGANTRCLLVSADHSIGNISSEIENRNMSSDGRHLLQYVMRDNDVASDCGNSHEAASVTWTQRCRCRHRQMNGCMCVYYKCTAIIEARTQWHENGANINPYRMYWTFSSVHPKSVQMRWIDINTICDCPIRLTRPPAKIFSQTTEHTQNNKWRFRSVRTLMRKNLSFWPFYCRQEKIHRFCTHEYRNPRASHALSSANRGRQLAFGYR